MKNISFEAEIKEAEIGKGGSFIEFPYDVEELFGKKGRIKVQCKFDKELYRGSLVKMGTDCHIVGIKKDIMKKIGKKPGDYVSVEIEEDFEERKINPNETLLREIGKNKELQAKYDKLSYSRKKEMNELIESAKKEETVKNRIDKVIKEIKGK